MKLGVRAAGALVAGMAVAAAQEAEAAMAAAP